MGTDLAARGKIMDTIDITMAVSRLVLGWFFLVVGGMQVFLEKDDVVRRLGGWAHGHPDFGLKLIGLAEIVAGAAMVLPLAYVMPAGLDVAAAATIILLMAGSVFEHARRRQYLRLTASALLAGMAGVNVDWTLIG